MLTLLLSLFCLKSFNFFVFMFICIREKLIRLQHENKILKLNEGATVDKQLTIVQSMLDDARSRINELETDNR